MTREEALDWLARVKSNTVNHSLEMPLWWNKPLAEALDMAIKALEQESRWIPVSERLPKELYGVLVYCPTDDNIYCAYLEKGVWKIFSPEALEEIKEIVTAWMPLPKAYKEVEE